MDIYTHAAIKIQSVWRMWLEKRVYHDRLYYNCVQDDYDDYTEEELRNMEWDALDAAAQYECHAYHSR